MKLRDIFILEGAKDADYRETIDHMIEVIQQNVRNKKPDRMITSLAPDVIAVYVGAEMDVPAELVPYFENLLVKFRATPRRESSTAMYQRGDKFEHVTIFFHLERPRKVQEWQDTVAKNAAAWVRSRRDSLFHELVHLVDTHRFKDPEHINRSAVAADKRDENDPDTMFKYFNAPHELNAYFQSHFDNLEQRFTRGFPTFEAAMKSIGANTSAQFVKWVRDSMDTNVVDHLTQDNVHRLDKRSYQFYQDLRHRFSG
jgi:hypothetical protein